MSGYSVNIHLSAKNFWHTVQLISLLHPTSIHSSVIPKYCWKPRWDKNGEISPEDLDFIWNCL